MVQLQIQSVRLQQHFSADQIEQIEDQHRVLRTAYRLDESVSQQISVLSKASSFREAWSDGRFGGNDCRLLRKFCGAIACAATDPIVVKSSTEFSLINWRRSPFGLSLVDFCWKLRYMPGSIVISRACVSDEDIMSNTEVCLRWLRARKRTS